MCLPTTMHSQAPSRYCPCHHFIIGSLYLMHTRAIYWHIYYLCIDSSLTYPFIIVAANDPAVPKRPPPLSLNPISGNGIYKFIAYPATVRNFILWPGSSLEHNWRDNQQNINSMTRTIKQSKC